MTGKIWIFKYECLTMLTIAPKLFLLQDTFDGSNGTFQTKSVLIVTFLYHNLQVPQRNPYLVCEVYLADCFEWSLCRAVPGVISGRILKRSTLFLFCLLGILLHTPGGNCWLRKFHSQRLNKRCWKGIHRSLLI